MNSVSDDEKDKLYFMRKTRMGRWVVLPDMYVTSVKLDVVQFSLNEPVPR